MVKKNDYFCAFSGIIFKHVLRIIFKGDITYDFSELLFNVNTIMYQIKE